LYRAIGLHRSVGVAALRLFKSDGQTTCLGLLPKFSKIAAKKPAGMTTAGF
jgi:hypothetical protein